MTVYTENSDTITPLLLVPHHYGCAISLTAISRTLSAADADRCFQGIQLPWSPADDYILFALMSAVLMPTCLKGMVSFVFVGQLLDTASAIMGKSM
jgi:hypothetical protein